ncbi:MAG: hypothetical protein IJW23_10485 [Lentisphaeria bacterium]|nr:hypothetical protein [Lentisphaeria bacterium]
MKRKQIIGIFAGILTILFFAGCATDFRAEAAEEAREYLLKNMEGLTVLQQNYIRYNDPIILNTTLWNSVVPSPIPDAHIVARHERNVYTDPRRDMMMHCFGWRVPGMDRDIYVVGTAQRNFQFWEADRIVLRSREKADLAGMKLRRKAMSFALSAYPELKGKIFHRVRYAEPEVHTSLFFLDQPSGYKRWDSFLNQIRQKEPIQVSAVWIDPETNNRIIVMGTSREENLNDWRPLRTYELSEDEAKVYIGSKYTVYPEDEEDPFFRQKKVKSEGETEESED